MRVFGGKHVRFLVHIYTYIYNSRPIENCYKQFCQYSDMHKLERLGKMEVFGSVECPNLFKIFSIFETDRSMTLHSSRLLNRLIYVSIYNLSCRTGRTYSRNNDSHQSVLISFVLKYWKDSKDPKLFNKPIEGLKK